MEETTLWDYIEVLRRRKGIVLMVFGCAVLVSLVVSLFFIPRTYEAETRLILLPLQGVTIPPMVTALPSLQEQLPIAKYMSGGANLYLGILKSRGIAEQAIKDLGLQEKYRSHSLEAAIRELRKNTSIELDKEGLVVVRARFSGMPQGVPLMASLWGKKSNPRDDWEARRLAADIANCYVKLLRDYTQASALDVARRHRVFIEAQLARVKRDLRGAEDVLNDFQTEHKLVAIQEAYKAKIENLANLEATGLTAGTALAENEKQLKALRQKLGRQEATIISEKTYADNPIAQKLREQLVTKEVDLANALKTYTEEYPQVVMLETQIANLREALKGELTKVVATETEAANPVHQHLLENLISVEVTNIGLKAKKKALGAILKEKEEELSHLPQKELVYTRLKRQVNVQETLYTMLTEELERAKIAEAREAMDFQVLDTAVPPERKVRPRVMLNLAIAGVLGLMLGTFLAFLVANLEGQKNKNQGEQAS